MCKCAPSLLKLRDQLNSEFPHRDRASDGCCGDARHQATKSDHNPDASGYAHAFDVDEGVGLPGDQPLLGWVPLLLKDPRTKYIIYERRIYYARCNTHSSTCDGHAYTGINAHDRHLHLSIVADATFYTSAVWPMPPEAYQPEPTQSEEEEEQMKVRYLRGDGDPAVYLGPADLVSGHWIHVVGGTPEKEQVQKDTRYMLEASGIDVLEPPPGVKTETLANGHRVWVIRQSVMDQILGRA